jgi:hypothetical protein
MLAADVELVPQQFWVQMANGSSVRPIGMILDLEMVVQGHTFTIFRHNYGPSATGCLPHPVGRAMVTGSPDEARLAEKRAYIPAQRTESPDTHDQGSYTGQGHNFSLCGKRQYVGGPYGGGR